MVVVLSFNLVTVYRPAAIALQYGMIYALVKKDSELLSKTPPGSRPSDPMLYEPAIHKARREGQYHSMKPKNQLGVVVQLPKQ